MIEPFSKLEEQELDVLEDQLVEAGTSYGSAMRTYAKFLLMQLQNEAYRGSVFTTEDVELLSDKLKKAAASIGDPALADSRKQWRVELWNLHKTLSGDRPRVAAFVRCAVCCLYPEDEWDPDVQEDPTPAPLFFALLKKFDAGIGVEFLHFVRSTLLPSQRADPSRF